MKKLAIVSSSAARADEFAHLVGEIWKVSTKGDSIIINIDGPLNDMVWSYFNLEDGSPLEARMGLELREFLNKNNISYLHYGRHQYIKQQVAQPPSTLMILCEVRDLTLMEYLKGEGFQFVHLETTPQEDQVNFASQFPSLMDDWKTFVQLAPSNLEFNKVNFNGAGALKVVSSLID
jgi:hypothetical protein